MRLSIVIAAAFMLCACESATTIRVSDEEARIYINGEFAGTGSARYSDRRLAFSRQEVILRKEGCENQNYSFRRNERPAVGAIIGAYYLAVPILWLSKYRSHRAYEFYCEPTEA